jgi:hypothetical protein
VRLLSPYIPDNEKPSDREDRAMTKGHDNRHLDEPTYWFAVLEIARERGDFERAWEAKRQLERLGVRVSYERPKMVAQ